jgi:hypothetical protein
MVIQVTQILRYNDLDLDEIFTQICGGSHVFALNYADGERRSVRSSLNLIRIHADTRDQPNPVFLTQPRVSSDRHLISMTNEESFAGLLRDLTATESVAYGGKLVDRRAEKSAAIPAALAYAFSTGADGWSGPLIRQPSRSTGDLLSGIIPEAEETGIPLVSFEGDASSFERIDEWLIDLEEAAFAMKTAHDEPPFGISSLMPHRVF